MTGWHSAQNKDIRHRKLDAVLFNDATMLTFWKGDYSAQEMAQAFREALSKIKRVVAGFFPPLFPRIR